MVIHSAAGANGVQFPGRPSILRFNSRASILTGKQCLAMRCTVAITVIVYCSVVDTYGLVHRLQTWRSIKNGRSKAQLKTREWA